MNCFSELTVPSESRKRDAFGWFVPGIVGFNLDSSRNKISGYGTRPARGDVVGDQLV